MRRATALLLVVLFVLPTVTGVGVFAASDAQNQTSSDEYTLDELQENGKRYESAPPSMRFLGDYGSATVRYTPVSPGKNGWKYLEPGTTIHSNEVALRAVRLAPSDEIDESLNVTVVAWQKGEKEVSTGNGTVTRPTATNVSVYHHQVSLGRGYDLANISLPAHYDESYQITMWVEENPDARWRFTHQSVESKKGLPFPATWGGYWQFTTTNLLIWILAATGIVAIAVPASIRQTGRGPNMGLLFWAIVLGLGSALIGGGAYVWTASLLTAAPPVAAFLIAGVIGIVMLETMEYGVYRVALIRLFTEETKNPRGDLANSAEGGEFEVVTLAQTEEGPKAIRDGIRPWIARLFSGGSPLYGLDRLELEFDLGTPDVSLTSSPADKLIFVDEDPEQLIDYEPETLSFELPLTEFDPETGEERWSWTGAVTVAFYAVVSGGLAFFALQKSGIGGARTGALAFAGVALYALFTTAEAGRAVFVPAVGCAQDATATAMYREAEIDGYETLEAALNALVEERNSSDELLDTLEEMDAESVVKEASSRDTSPGEFVGGSDSPTTTSAGGDD
ncbi:hypothetical protein [Halorussus sp. MSC15.2]|uniref:hypothetical protein n=1 Tax=Halorussus sp. MSC15.2 TaxID=2283638 RepID=UPI0013CFE7C4|nr:hypothetical protein [Halorussus sp. MSC15.2]NEU56754.1 hypothetical protein [Halorussus sp. MSC15.2]